jgi:hypothetical protein
VRQFPMGGGLSGTSETLTHALRLLAASRPGLLHVKVIPGVPSYGESGWCFSDYSRNQVSGTKEHSWPKSLNAAQT